MFDRDGNSLSTNDPVLVKAKQGMYYFGRVFESCYDQIYVFIRINNIDRSGAFLPDAIIKLPKDEKEREQKIMLLTLEGNKIII